MMYYLQVYQLLKINDNIFIFIDFCESEYIFIQSSREVFRIQEERKGVVYEESIVIYYILQEVFVVVKSFLFFQIDVDVR